VAQYWFVIALPCVLGMLGGEIFYQHRLKHNSLLSFPEYRNSMEAPLLVDTHLLLGLFVTAFVLAVGALAYHLVSPWKLRIALLAGATTGVGITLSSVYYQVRSVGGPAIFTMCDVDCSDRTGLPTILPIAVLGGSIAIVCAPLIGLLSRRLLARFRRVVPSSRVSSREAPGASR
jgi:hypothetical protein